MRDKQLPVHKSMGTKSKTDFCPVVVSEVTDFGRETSVLVCFYNSIAWFMSVLSWKSRASPDLIP